VTTAQLASSQELKPECASTAPSDGFLMYQEAPAVDLAHPARLQVRREPPNVLSAQSASSPRSGSAALAPTAQLASTCRMPVLLHACAVRKAKLRRVEEPSIASCVLRANTSALGRLLAWRVPRAGLLRLPELLGATPALEANTSLGTNRPTAMTAPQDYSIQLKPALHAPSVLLDGSLPLLRANTVIAAHLAPLGQQQG